MYVAVMIAGGWFYCAEPPDTVKKEMAAIEGEWTMVSGEINGQAMPENYLKTGKRESKDGVTTVTFGGMLFMKAKYTLDPSKSPKAIDYEFVDGPTKGKKQLGIYEIDGDSVKFCFASPGKNRPTEFAAKEGSGNTYSVWKKAKK
jgi:uncharacterized protein (TIGR03067 family)